MSDRARLERRYRDLYQATPAMLHTIDPEGRLTDVSDHWLDKLGYTRDEVLGRSILDFMTDASRAPLVGRVREIINAGDIRNVPRQMVKFMAQHLMEFDVDARCSSSTLAACKPLIRIEPSSKAQTTNGVL